MYFVTAAMLQGGAYFAGGPGSSLSYFNEPNFIDNFAVSCYVPLSCYPCDASGTPRKSTKTAG